MRVLLLLLAPAAFAQVTDPKELIRAAFSRGEDVFDSLRNYTYLRDREVRQLDSAGGVKDTESTVHEVLILSGEPYFRLVEKDGRKLMEKEAAKEQSKMDKEAAKRSKRKGSEEEKQRAERRRALREITEAFTWKMAGADTVSGIPVWAIDAHPNPAFRPQSREAKIFQKMSGRLWISQKDPQLAKIEAQVDDTISFGFFLIRLQPGFRFTFEQAWVNGEVWLPAKAHVKGNAKIGGLKTVRFEMETRYRDYRKFQSDSRIVAGGETK